MTISEERKKRVIDLYYNQGKTTREIAKIERMSIRDISPTLKEEESKRQRLKDQQQQEEMSSKAYKLFSDGKHPVDVAIALSLREPEATRLYREYWKLKRLHKLNLIYEQLGDDGIGDFLNLCKLAKKEGVSRQQVVKLLQLVDEDNYIGLSSFEKGRKLHIDEIHELDMQIERSKKHLHSLDDEIASAKALLSSYLISCERKRQESEQLNNDITRLETLVSRFKSSDGEYLKIKKTVEEEVRIVLTDGKVLLQFALASVIEAIRRNPDKYNNLLVSNSSLSSSTTIISAQQSSSQPEHCDEEYNAMILEVADKLYSSLLKQLVSTIMDNATVELKTSSSQSKLP